LAEGYPVAIAASVRIGATPQQGWSIPVASLNLLIIIIDETTKVQDGRSVTVFIFLPPLIFGDVLQLSVNFFYTVSAAYISMLEITDT
jgi:hypothetical protein